MFKVINDLRIAVGIGEYVIARGVSVLWVLVLAVFRRISDKLEKL